MSTITKSKIEWCDYSWSPMVGCEGNCTVESCGYQCYWEKYYKQHGRKAYPELKDHQDVQFIERNFEKELPGKPSKIFINPFSDPFWWDFEKSNRIWDKVADNPQHTFILLTKHEYVYDCWCRIFGRLKNLWCGLTINLAGQMGKQDIFNLIPNNIRFLSLEPLRKEIPIGLFKPHLVDWIILGGQNGPGEKFYPPIKWVTELAKFCSKNKISLFFKDNLRIDRGGWNVKPKRRYQWPEVKK